MLKKKRKHLKQHVSKEPKAIEVVKDWHAKYDDDGNPIDEDTDDDNSRDDNKPFKALALA